MATRFLRSICTAVCKLYCVFRPGLEMTDLLHHVDARINYFTAHVAYLYVCGVGMSCHALVVMHMQQTWAGRQSSAGVKVSVGLPLVAGEVGE